MTGLSDDNSVAAVQMGFNFHYYWVDYNKVNIGSNGWISFNNVGNIASCFPDMPAAGGSGDNYVAPFMTDLNLFTGLGAAGNPGKFRNNLKFNQKRILGSEV